jgi:beta-lactamase regulating signal transducer with metallopeptidase domain
MFEMPALTAVTDAAVKFACLVLVAEVVTRRINHSAASSAHRVWLAVLATGLALPFIAWTTPATVRIEPSAGAFSVVPAPVTSAPVIAGVVVTMALGTLWGMVRLIAGIATIRRLISGSTVILEGESIETGARRLHRLAGMQTRRAARCRFAENHALAVPVTVGHWRPWILLPADWRTWPAPRLAAVMAHEGAHIDRGDYAIGLAGAVFRALWWWHPAAWMAISRLHLTAEIASDARAVADGRADYASHLLDLAQAAGGRRIRFGWTLGATSRLRERVDALLDDTPGTPRIGVAVRVTLAAIAIAATCAAAPVRFSFARSAGAPSVPFFDHDLNHGVGHGHGH